MLARIEHFDYDYIFWHLPWKSANDHNGLTLFLEFNMLKNLHLSFYSSNSLYRFHLVTLFLLVQFGCTETLVESDAGLDASKAATLLLAPAADFSWTADSLTVTFSNLSLEADRFKWEFGDAQTSNEINPVHTYAAAGDYMVTLTVATTSGKLKSTQTVSVTDAGEPPPPMGSVPGPDTSDPFSIDMGDAGEHTPGSFKELPLRLADNGEPVVTPVNDVIGVVCIGMSNARQECDYFVSDFMPTVSTEINQQVKVVDCAVGGNAIERWVDPANDRKLWDKCIDSKLGAQAGITADQVRVIYHKAANMFTGPTPGEDIPYPPYPDPESDYFNFYDNLGLFAARVKTFFPNLQAVYTTSRSYGGYSSKATRGEPLSYEEGHALNTWLQDNPEVEGVWYGWGPYIWAPDCGTGDVNGSDVCYVREDYQSDGVHPGAGAKEKIAGMLHGRLLQHGWYRSN